MALVRIHPLRIRIIAENIAHSLKRNLIELERLRYMLEASGFMAPLPDEQIIEAIAQLYDLANTVSQYSFEVEAEIPSYSDIAREVDEYLRREGIIV